VTSVIWLDESNLDFPSPEDALLEPNGLLAAGGDLSPRRLLKAYANGIFPWFDESQPILWWSPNPRAVLFHKDLKISRSLRKRLKRNQFTVKLNTNFEAVIDACALPRSSIESDEPETWITSEMREAYITLHQLGKAHSIECYLEDRLVGGLYGVGIGRLFFGESMFHHETDASKVAFAYLSRLLETYDCPLIDCQIENDHLTSLGCRTIPRTAFLEYLQDNTNTSEEIPWQDLNGALPHW
jgi:leucyl/phenylalanyl-tRNA--protein transferase